MNEQDIRKNKRYKILSVPHELILSLLFPVSESNLISKINLPDDVYPVSVWYRPERQSFEFLLASEKYDPVPCGFSIPELNYETLVISKYQLTEE